MKIVVNYVRPEPHEIPRDDVFAHRRDEDERATDLHVTDRSVRAHEQTHLRLLGGAAAGPIQYDLVNGPDGRRYAVGGRIKVDLNPVPGDPDATLRKARLVRLAALGPNDPSSADMRVAAAAYRLEAAARREQRLDEESAHDIDAYA